MPEFTPPELAHANLAATVRHSSSDLFALAIHIYQLLMQGEHPFRGVWNGPGEIPDIGIRTARGIWAHRTGGILTPRPSAIPINHLPDSLVTLFRRTFEDGAKDPNRRPEPAEWHRELTYLSQHLKTCKADPTHIYHDKLKVCPWCAHQVRATVITQQPMAALTGTTPRTTSVPPMARLASATPTAPAAPTPAAPAAPSILRPYQSPVTSRRRTWHRRLVGAAVVLAILVGIAALVTRIGAGVPHGAGDPTIGTLTAHDPQTEMQAMYAILTNSAVDRHNVINAIIAARKCADLASDESAFTTARKHRSAQTQQASGLDMSDVSGGAALKSELVNALSLSEQADEQYVAWVSDLRANGCARATAKDNPSYQAATSLSIKVDKIKKSFSDDWNAIASGSDLDPIQPTDI